MKVTNFLLSAAIQKLILVIKTLIFKFSFPNVCVKYIDSVCDSLKTSNQWTRLWWSVKFGTIWWIRYNALIGATFISNAKVAQNHSLSLLVLLLDAFLLIWWQYRNCILIYYIYRTFKVKVENKFKLRLKLKSMGPTI